MNRDTNVRHAGAGGIGLLTSWLTTAGGGVADSVHGLADGLRLNCRRDVTIFGLEEPAAAGVHELRTECAVATARVLGPRAFGFAPELVADLARADLELLHVHGLWMYTSVAALAWSFRTSRPRIVSPHGMLEGWALRNSAGRKQIAALLYENRHLREADCIHALCEAEARAIHGLGLGNPVCVVPNGVTLPDLASAAGAFPPWAAGLPRDARVLFYLGRLHPKKNLPALLEAWRHCADLPLARHWWLVVAGWDQDGHEAELRAAATGIPRMVMAGPQFRADKDASFRRADAFVLPSLSEGLPVAVLEAWSYGLPVLMTRECNLPDGFASGAAVETSSGVAGLAARLEWLLLRDPEELQVMGMRGRALVERQYTWPAVAARMSTVYDWLTGGRPVPADLWQATGGDTK